MTTKTQTLKIDQIRIDGGTQPRVAIDEDVVVEYADLYVEGVDLPPVTVFHDGSTYWLADGFHRYWASKQTEREAIAVDVQQGTRRDAILYSVGANATHGLRRSNADKRKAVLTMLQDDEWSQYSDHEIARQCNVTQPTVGRHRAALKQFISENTPATDQTAPQPESSLKQFISEDGSKSTQIAEKSTSKLPQNDGSSLPSQQRTYKTKHGTVSSMKTGKIGRTSKSKTSKTPRFGKNAYRPKACHSEDGPVPMRAISLPLKNPIQAARSMISIYGDDYMRQVATELNRIFQSQKGLSNDCTAHEPHGTADSDHLHERHTGHCQPVA